MTQGMARKLTLLSEKIGHKDDTTLSSSVYLELNRDIFVIQGKSKLRHVRPEARAIVSYFILVDTPLGHQFDDDAVLTRESLGRKVIRLDSHILNLVGRRTLLLAAVVTLVIAVVRRCSFVGVIAVAGFGSAVVGAELLKNVFIWRMLVPKDALLESGFQTNTYPSGHTTFVTSVALGLLLVSPSRWRPLLAVAGGCICAAIVLVLVVVLVLE
jgi:membrane-associated phospholipid phosphatase